MVWSKKTASGHVLEIVSGVDAKKNRGRVIKPGSRSPAAPLFRGTPTSVPLPAALQIRTSAVRCDQGQGAGKHTSIGVERECALPHPPCEGKPDSTSKFSAWKWRYWTEESLSSLHKGSQSYGDDVPCPKPQSKPRTTPETKPASPEPPALMPSCDIHRDSIQ